MRVMPRAVAEAVANGHDYRLSDLLREHGIEPGDGDRKSA